MIKEVSLPASAANKLETPVSVQPDASTEVVSDKQDQRADRIHTTDEKILPAKKQTEPNEMLESASVTPNTVKQTIVIGPIEKGSTIQVDSRAVAVTQQLIRQLNGRLKSGSTSMHLQLNPEQLGAIEVEMVKDSQGVSVTFFAEQASTGKLLETQFSQLRQSLADSGVQLSGLNISQHSHSGQEGGFLQQNTNFAQNSQHETLQREVNTKESARAERVTGQMSEVDYLI